MACANRDNFTSFLLGWILFLCLISLAILNTMLNKGGDGGRPGLAPDLRGKLSASHHWVWRQLRAYPAWPLLCRGAFSQSLESSFHHKKDAKICQILVLPIRRWSWGFYPSFCLCAEPRGWFVPSLHPWDKSCLITVSDVCECVVELTSGAFHGGFLHLCSSGILASGFCFW